MARRRSGGVFNRPAGAYPSASHVNDGGHDAPLTPRSRTVYRLALLGIVALGFALINFLR